MVGGWRTVDTPCDFLDVRGARRMGGILGRHHLVQLSTLPRLNRGQNKGGYDAGMAPVADDTASWNRLVCGFWYHLSGKTRGEPFERIWPFVLILGPVEVALSMLSGWGYGHYYLSLLPVGALYMGFLVWLVSKERLAAPAFLTLILLYATVNYHMDIYNKVADIVRTVRDASQEHPLTRNERDQMVAEVVERHSDAQDTILVWGAETQIHLLTGRDSPTRFFYQYPLVRSSYVEQSQLDEFISDVTNGRPAVIIDARNSRLPPLDEASRMEWQPQRRYMHDPTQFQQLFDFVEAEYDLIEEIEDWRVYARN